MSLYYPRKYPTQSLLEVKTWRKPSPTLRQALSQLMTSVAIENPWSLQYFDLSRKFPWKFNEKQ